MSTVREALQPTTEDFSELWETALVLLGNQLTINPHPLMKPTTLLASLSSLGLCCLMIAAPVHADEVAKPGGEGKKPSPEVMQKLLEKFDADGDGKLNAEEGAAAKQAMAERRGEAGSGDGKAEMLKRFDKDGDGKLNSDEAKAAKEAMAEHRKEEMLKRFDKNKDGELDSREEKLAREEMEQHQKDQMLERFDKDKDGKLDSREERAAKEEMAERRGGKS